LCAGRCHRRSWRARVGDAERLAQYEAILDWRARATLAYVRMEYRYLDTTTSELAAGGCDIHLFCACGRHVMFAPDDFAKWPGSSLHRIAAKLRCSRCGCLGNIPEVRITAVSARMGHASRSAGPEGTGSGSIATTHPSRRRRRKDYTDGVQRLKAPTPLTGRALKDALMPRAREMARTGRHQRWLDVVLQFESWEQDALRYYLTDKERDELETLASSARRYAVVGLPPCCPVGAGLGH
jgi:hypothetical protein